VKKINISLLCLLSVLSCFAQQSIELKNWKFSTGDNPEWSQPGFNDSRWQTLAAGDFWALHGFENTRYGWYRIKFRLPSDIVKSSIFKDSILFDLGRIYDREQTYLNGKPLGQNARLVSGANEMVSDLSTLDLSWKYQRNYLVAVNNPHLLWGKENVLAIRVHHSDWGGGLITSPVNIRMKNVDEYLCFDIESKVLEINADGTMSKTIVLKNNSPLAEITGKLTMTITDVEAKQVLETKDYPVDLKNEADFSVSFKGDLHQRLKAEYTFTETTTKAKAYRTQALPLLVNNPKTEEVSGEYYDWTKTRQMEQPKIRNYDQALIMKLAFGAFKGNNQAEQALEVIRKLDNITLGLPKIIYLVGWDKSMHPAWDEVNDKLKRDQGATALESLKWLMKEAKKYNTTISFHINMIDAFPASSLWKEYLDKDIIAKDNKGMPIKGEAWGAQSYQLSYAQEWKLGYAQKRIDKLLNMFPELIDGGTIHIDAFHSMRPTGPQQPISPYLGLSMEDEMSAQRKIFRYWRKQGIDVTCEGYMCLRNDPFVGLQAGSWWYEESAIIGANWNNKPQNLYSLPAELAAFTPMHAEEEINKDPETLPGLIDQFCLKVVPWFYKRNADVSIASNVIITDDEVICPILWKNRAMIAYIKQADITNRKIRIPSTWVDVREVQLYNLTLEGLKPSTVVKVDNGMIIFNISKNQPTVIMPVGMK
jgi:hypothetical protein